jgi:hypothetical protein
MKCPHCLQSFFADSNGQFIEWPDKQWLKDKDGYWHVRTTKCPSCNRATIYLELRMVSDFSIVLKEMQIWPKGTARSPLPPEVPEDFVADYKEACVVLADSPKASAALSRRCLQHLLREKARVNASDLSKEIDQVLASKTLPSDLADAIDAVRQVGNFAAHPLKSTNTGLILDVEPGEAEWLLDVLESLFDFYFVRPAQLALKRDALNKKLADASKPPMKQTKP